MQPLIDSHIHLWDPHTTPRAATPLVKALGWNRRLLHRVARLATPSATMNFIGKPDHVCKRYASPEYQHDVAGLNRLGYRFRGAVHVEAGWKAGTHLQLADETAWLENDIQTPLQAIVGCAELDHPQFESLLQAHIDASPRFTGVRDKLASDPRSRVMTWARSSDLLNSPRWRQGLRTLAERNFGFDAWAYSPQLADLRNALASSPDTRVALCHLGTPIAQGEGAGERRQWQVDMQALARLPNVSVKLSGLTMPIVGWRLHEKAAPVDVDQLYDRLAPFYRFVLDTFGPGRCMFGSNFPIDKVSVNYSDLVEVLDRVVGEYGDDARAQVFHDTASAHYEPFDP